MATIGARFACKANWPFASSINLAEPESCQRTGILSANRFSAKSPKVHDTSITLWLIVANNNNGG